MCKLNLLLYNWAIVASYFITSFALESDEVYKCSICVESVERAKSLNLFSSRLEQVCRELFTGPRIEVCDVIASEFEVDLSGRDSKTICIQEGFCDSKHESWRNQIGLYLSNSNAGIDVRVSKALGSRGYDKIRLSVIANHTIDSEYFSYKDAFQHKWTSNDLIGDTYLNTGIVSVTPGQVNSFKIEGETVEVFVPKEDDGVRGFIIADPCFTSDYITCTYKDDFDTFNEQTTLLNAVMEHDDAHFFQILGDNFYDQIGTPTATWFSALTQKTKSKFLSTVPGNHDFWVHGSPALWTPWDQLGNGLMQFYAMDTVASKSSDSSPPYDFSVSPTLGWDLPPASNFFFYHKLGNLAFIGWSGAHSEKEQDAYFDEACKWASSVNPAAVLLLSHWNVDEMGCKSGMSSPKVYEMMKSRASCAPIASKLKYFEGHAHCNYVTENDTGFMIGGLGMYDGSCAAVLGFSIVDSTDGQIKVYYFPVNEKGKFNNYETILTCIKEKGVSGCYDLATVWSAVPITN